MRLRACIDTCTRTQLCLRSGKSSSYHCTVVPFLIALDTRLAPRASRLKSQTATGPTNIRSLVTLVLLTARHMLNTDGHEFG